MQVALIFDPDSAGEVAKAKRFFKFPETEPEPEPESPPIETEPEPETDVSMDEIIRRAQAISDTKGKAFLGVICKRVGIRRIRECPDNKRAKLVAEMALHV